MKKLYKFYWDCQRMGSLDGVFVANDSDIEAIVGRRVSFGEVLGKHSDIKGMMEAEDISLITDDPVVVKIFEDHLNGEVGFNPLGYVLCEHGIQLNEEECETCEETE